MIKIHPKNHCSLKFWNFSGSVLFWLLASNPIAAEIIPDQTLPINSSVTAQDSIRVIEGGTRRGDNLFHSFKEFSFSILTKEVTGDTAFFNNDSAVRNIITRVTGGSGSNIDGIIRTNGAANLFLINPDSIIFGSNASLDIGGSFVASTANSLKFADGNEFSATASQTYPLLTVSVPIGLQFGSNPGEIVNRSQASPNKAVNSIGLPVGLQIPNGKTLALVGGNVSVMGGNLTALNGRIELGSVAGGGFVNLTQIEAGYALGYVDVQNFGNIQLSQGALVDASGFGGGAIQGRNITFTDNSLIFSITSNANRGGDLGINATESVKLSGGSQIGTFAAGKGQAGDVLVKALSFLELEGTASDGTPSFLGSQVFKKARGNGGNLTIETGRLLIRDGAIVDTSTFGAGKAGNVLVKADSIELMGESPDGHSSGIFAQVAENAIDDAGDAGTLTLETKHLIVQGGAQISTAARKGGNGGNLTVNADSIQLSGTAPSALADPLDKNRSGIFVSAEQGATGNAGNLNITTELFTIEDGARISADNIGSGSTGGNATLDVRQLIIRDGGEVRAGSFGEGPGGALTIKASESVEVIGAGEIGSTPVRSSLFTQAQGTGNAGNLNIFTPNLTVRDGGEVNVSATGSGKAGNLQVEANSIHLDRGTLTAATASGEGGDIKLQIDDLLFLENNSLISAEARGNAKGGNIIFNNPSNPKGFVIAVPSENNDIIANAFEGEGGFIQINAQGIFGIAQREESTPLSDITAFSQKNPELNGVVEINTPEIDPSEALAELPNVPVTVEVAQGCQAEGKQASVEFFNTGKGGLAPSPYEPLSSSNIWEDVPPPTQETANSANEKSTSTSPDKIIEAQGWQIDEKGGITLVAEVPNNLSQSRCRLQ